jgi:hypothetical protein
MAMFMVLLSGLNYGGTVIVQRTRAKFAGAKLPCQAVILAPHQNIYCSFFDNSKVDLIPRKSLTTRKPSCIGGSASRPQQRQQPRQKKGRETPPTK